MTAIISAAGQGLRLGGRDKAAIELAPGRSAWRRVTDALKLAGLDRAIVVRRRGADPLPAVAPGGASVQVVEVDGEGDMLASVQAALALADPGPILHWPVDYAMVDPGTIALLCSAGQRGAGEIVLPLHGDRPGHPLWFSAATRVEIEALDPNRQTLRDVVRADSERVLGVPVRDPWVHRDLDTPHDLAIAEAAAQAESEGASGGEVLATMRAHRSRRQFDADTAPTASQVARWVDAARHASTSSFIQAYSVVEVRDAAQRARIAELWADQPHVASAPVVLAVCADLYRIATCCERHGEAIDTTGIESLLQATIDAALLGQNLLLAAEAQGFGGCMIGAARNRPVASAQLLNLPRHVYVAFGLVLGKPIDDPQPRTRLPLGVLHHRERYDQDVEVALDAADDAMREWASQSNLRARQRAHRAGQPSPRPINETRGYTDRMAYLWGQAMGGGYKARRDLAEALRELGFGLG